MTNYNLSNLLLLLSVAIVLLAQTGISICYSIYKKKENSRKITGAEVAREILEKNGLNDIYVTATNGNLSDHYDPKRKVVKLSKDIYEGTTIASLSVAAHEVGHALQDKDGYLFMRVRSALVPVVNFSSTAGYFAILIGFLFNAMNLVWVGIVLEMVILLFQLITLPVEFNASRRAKKQLAEGRYLEDYELRGSRIMLGAAAFTYVAGVLSTLLQVFRLVLAANDRRR